MQDTLRSLLAWPGGIASTLTSSHRRIVAATSQTSRKPELETEACGLILIQFHLGIGGNQAAKRVDNTDRLFPFYIS